MSSFKIFVAALGFCGLSLLLVYALFTHFRALNCQLDMLSLENPRPCGRAL